MIVLVVTVLVLATSIYTVFTLYKKNQLVFEEFDAQAELLKPVNIQKERRDLAESRFVKMQSEYKENRNSLTVNKKKCSLYELGIGTVDVTKYESSFAGESVSVLEKQLASARTRTKELVRSKAACTCDTEWVLSGSRAEGRKMTNREIKLRLRNFDNMCKAALVLVDWNNIGRLKSRLKGTFEDINSSGKYTEVHLQRQYLDLRTKELELSYTLGREKQRIKEEEREERQRVREAEREEAKIKIALEKARREREFHEELVANELEKMQTLTGESLADMQSNLERHKNELKQLVEMENRAISLAQQTRAGYVYVISNVKSFGENICKIGMTRRVDPNDRVKELGDASVPELFDVHAFAYSEDAPALEKELHVKYKDQRVNMVNSRKEFFYINHREVVADLSRRDNVEMMQP